MSLDEISLTMLDGVLDFSDEEGCNTDNLGGYNPFLPYLAGERPRNRSPPPRHECCVANVKAETLASIPFFTGTDPSFSAEKFIEQIEFYGEIGDWTDPLKIRALKQKLMGKAEQIVKYEASLRNQDDWPRFKAAFIRRFQPLATVAQKRKAFVLCRQREGETVEEYGLRLLAAAESAKLQGTDRFETRAYERENDIEKLSVFLEGLHPVIGQHVASQNPDSYERALEIARIYEPKVTLPRSTRETVNSYGMERQTPRSCQSDTQVKILAALNILTEKIADLSSHVNRDRENAPAVEQTEAVVTKRNATPSQQPVVIYLVDQRSNGRRQENRNFSGNLQTGNRFPQNAQITDALTAQTQQFIAAHYGSQRPNNRLAITQGVPTVGNPTQACVIYPQNQQVRRQAGQQRPRLLVPNEAGQVLCFCCRQWGNHIARFCPFAGVQQVTQQFPTQQQIMDQQSTAPNASSLNSTGPSSG